MMRANQYVALERCADANSILVFEHVNDETKMHHDSNTTKDSGCMYQSDDDLVSNKALSLEQGKKKPFLQKLKIIMSRKSKAHHTKKSEKDIETKIQEEVIDSNVKSSHFDPNRFRILVEVKPESNKESAYSFDGNFVTSYESVSSLSMGSEMKNIPKCSKKVLRHDVHDILTKEHKRHNSHGTMSTVFSLDNKSFLSIITSCFDHAGAIATCNMSQSESSCSLEGSSETYDNEPELSTE